MDNSETELLSITVTPAGAAVIKRLLGVTRWTFSLGIFYSCLWIADGLLRYARMSPERYISVKPLYWELKFHQWYLWLYTILFIFQLYSYLQFAQKSNKGLDTLDNEQFNGSFYFLYRSGVVAIICVVMGILLGILSVWANMAVANLAHGRG